MRCKECGSQVYKNVTVRLKTGCRECETAHPCEKCGRLHWASGEAVFNRGRAKAYLEGASVVHK